MENPHEIVLYFFPEDSENIPDPHNDFEVIGPDVRFPGTLRWQREGREIPEGAKAIYSFPANDATDFMISDDPMIRFALRLIDFNQGIMHPSVAEAAARRIFRSIRAARVTSMEGWSNVYSSAHDALVEKRKNRPEPYVFGELEDWEREYLESGSVE